MKDPAGLFGPASTVEAGLVLVDKYTLVRLLGKGAFGQVWLAHDDELDRNVAIKIISSGGSDRSVEELFLAEARTLARLRHPNIVQVFDAGRHNGFLFIVMEFVDGKPLREVVTGLEEVLEVGIAVADALKVAHSVGVVHGDMKSVNVLQGREPKVTKVIDFGLAPIIARMKIEGAHGQVVGTPSFMSPEQANCEPLDGRSDLYSLGVVLFQLLTGRLPFVTEQGRPVLFQVISEDPAPRVRSLNPEVPEFAEAVIARLLKKNRDDRYQSADEVRRELEAILQHVRAEDAIRAAEAQLEACRLLMAEIERREVWHIATITLDDAETLRRREENDAFFEGLQERRTEFIAAQRAWNAVFQAQRVGALPTELERRLGDAVEALYRDARRREDPVRLGFWEGAMAFVDPEGRIGERLEEPIAIALSSSAGVAATIEKLELGEGDDEGVYAPTIVLSIQLSQTPKSAPLAPGYYCLIIPEQPLGSGSCASVRRPFRVLDQGYAIHVNVYPKRVVGDLVYMPAGVYWIGGDDSKGAMPPHGVVIAEDFLIRPGLVTVGPYRKYLESLLPAECDARTPLNWKDQTDDRCPVTGISWCDTSAFLAAAGNRSPQWVGARLPTREEWLVACATWRFGYGIRCARERLPKGTTPPPSWSCARIPDIAHAPSGVYDLGFGIEIGLEFLGSPVPGDDRIPFFGRSPDSEAARSLWACTLGPRTTKFPKAVFRAVRVLDPNLRIVS